jgi:hypothetical protein
VAIAQGGSGEKRERGGPGAETGSDAGSDSGVLPAVLDRLRDAAAAHDEDSLTASSPLISPQGGS